MSEAKPFEIPRMLIWEAWQDVRANRGAAGVDEESIQDFERNLKTNLYKIWNRMASGCYFPPPVKRVTIPKSGGGERHLGVPTIGDRVAQAAVKRVLEPLVEPHFHPDSYGYRRGKSAHDAVAQARQRCWSYPWVLDLDVKGFFDNIDHELMMKAVRRHTDCKWVLLYIERWLKAPVQLEDGTQEPRDKGTPQGGVVSPLLANLFLHYAFDEWLRRNQPAVRFERYADDIIVHCRSLKQAEYLRMAIAARLGECKLELHPVKTKIVYCKDDVRPKWHEHEKFDFLGFTFRPRQVKGQSGKFFVGFTPAISNAAAKEVRQTMRQWKLDRQTPKTLDELATAYNPVLRGWINYYGRFRPSELVRVVFKHLEAALVRWARAKYKRLSARWLRTQQWLRGIALRQPRLFAHWQLVAKVSQA